MSLTDLQTAAPQYMSPDVVAASPQIQNAFANVTMTPEQIAPAISHSANFNNASNFAVTAELQMEGPQPDIEYGAQEVTANINPELLAQIDNASMLPDIEPQVSGMGAELFGLGCSALEQAIQPVEEVVAPTPQPILQPEAPQMRYTHEVSAPSPNSMMG